MLLVVVLVAALVVTLALALVVLPTQGEEHTLQSLAGTHVSVPHACVLHVRWVVGSGRSRHAVAGTTMPVAVAHWIGRVA